MSKILFGKIFILAVIVVAGNLIASFVDIFVMHLTYADAVASFAGKYKPVSNLASTVHHGLQFTAGCVFGIVFYRFYLDRK